MCVFVPVCSRRGPTLTACQVVFGGAHVIGGVWGGEPCYSKLPLERHLTSQALYLCITALFFFGADLRGRWRTDHARLATVLAAEARGPARAVAGVYPPRSALDLVLGLLAMAIFLVQATYKWRVGTMAFLLQPCHVATVVQGLLLLRAPSPAGGLTAVTILPWLIGFWGAIAIPETGDLANFLEVEVYWIQHSLVGCACVLHVAVGVGSGAFCFF